MPERAPDSPRERLAALLFETHDHWQAQTDPDRDQALEAKLREAGYHEPATASQGNPCPYCCDLLAPPARDAGRTETP